MNETPKDTGEIIHLNRTVRTPDEIRELRMQELDRFAERLVDVAQAEPYILQRSDRMILSLRFMQENSLQELQQILTDLRDGIVAYDNVEKRQTPLQPRPVIEIRHIAAADAYLKKRKPISPARDEER
jgi:hypothetical protein